ncbi:4Fe-4S binding domain protein [Acidaminococcus sp. CAG:917]|nr:4Fe-4S binding domain protein [Acidaminococcus sp. CAG:917]
MAKITISKNLCKGCGLCVEACPKKIMQVSKTVSNDKGYFVAECVDMSQCIGCAFCATTCPDCVITVEK